MKLKELISRKNYDYISIRKDVSGVTGVPEDKKNILQHLGFRIG